jgi:GNAT superfamily N-acetyltransferase
MDSLPISIQEVGSKSALRDYIFLPAKLYRDHPNWVPPIYLDEWKFHDPKQNPSLGKATVIRLLANRGNKLVGRVMGIINHKYNETHGEKTARFFQLDCINDQQVAKALLDAVYDWAQKQSMQQVIGPFGFSDKDPQGLQIAGLEHLPVIATASNPYYLQSLVEGEGFVKHLDCVSFKVVVPNTIPALYIKVMDRIKKNSQVQLLEFKTKKALKPYIVPVFRLVNETYSDLFGFVPMTEEEMKRMAAQYLPILDPAFVKLVLNQEQELIAFVVAMPDMSKGIQQAKGKLFPFGFIQILLAAKKSKQLDLLLGAVRNDYRSIGLTALMGTALLQTAIERGFELMDSHLVLESNQPMCAEYQRIGGEIYKRYRVYKKPIG